MSLPEIPVVWLSYRAPTICARGTWDTGLLERIVDRRAWRPAGALAYRSVEGFEELPEGADGAVVIIGAQHHHLPDEVARLNADLARLRWVVLILAGDEHSLFPWRDLAPHPAMALWVMTPRPHVHGPLAASADFRRVTFVGEGYRDDTPDLLSVCAQEADERPLDWFFAGQVTHSRRRDLVAALRRIRGRWRGDLVQTPGFLLGLERPEYLRRMAAARVVPCPAGPGTPDSFRAYEALEAGALPLVDAVTPEAWPGYWSFLLGGADGVAPDPPPFPVVDDWADLPGIMEAALDGWPANANRASAWWQAEKRRLAYRLDDDVRITSEWAPGSTSELVDLVTVLVPTSPIPSHPSTEIIDETLDSLAAAGLDGCEVIVMADGVRPEQEHRRADYEEHLRRLLWSLNHGRRNHLPLVFGEHRHQAAMTRAALDLVRTPLVAFIEHDTPIVGEVPWQAMASAILETGQVDVIRLHHEAAVLKPHRYLMAGKVQEVGGVPMQPTAQWSQRPHVASVAWYRSMLDRHFSAAARTMIEDRLYGFLATPWVERHEWGDECRLWLYHPEGSIQRSTHLDGRAGEAKYGMTW